MADRVAQGALGGEGQVRKSFSEKSSRIKLSIYYLLLLRICSLWKSLILKQESKYASSSLIPCWGLATYRLGGVPSSSDYPDAHNCRIIYLLVTL